MTKIIDEQECTPVGCVATTVVATTRCHYWVGGGWQSPSPQMQTPSCSQITPDAGRPPPPPLDRMTDRRFWKHYLPLPSVTSEKIHLLELFIKKYYFYGSCSSCFDTYLCVCKRSSIIFADNARNHRASHRIRYGKRNTSTTQPFIRTRGRRCSYWDVCPLKFPWTWLLLGAWWRFIGNCHSIYFVSTLDVCIWKI